MGGGCDGRNVTFLGGFADVFGGGGGKGDVKIGNA